MTASPSMISPTTAGALILSVGSTATFLFGGIVHEKQHPCHYSAESGPGWLAGSACVSLVMVSK
jgi:hypothetical protein